MPFTTGAHVRQSTPVIQGTVQDAKYDAHTGKFTYLVNYSDTQGGHERWFSEDEIEANPAAQVTA